MSGKHSKAQSQEEVDYELALKGEEFDAGWQHSYDDAEAKREAGQYPYDQDPK